ncbi:MAG: GTPase Era [Firmicutes bacterium]|nr:GTPase Era [Bacillota bacterium]MCL1953686.1 GTPase Era [Bacillota bacterium]
MNKNDIDINTSKALDKNNRAKIGFFAIIGKPNVGKSSLLNKIVGQKVSIVSYKPQTTRNKITGIYSDEVCQFVFVDTPGLIKPDDRLTEFMANQIKSAVDGIDGLIFVLDAKKDVSQRELQTIENYARFIPIIVVVNKIDLCGYDEVYPIIQKLNNLNCLHTIVALSAQTGKNIEVLKQACLALSCDGERHFDDDAITDRTERFMVGEIVREKILLYFQQEIPHGVGVVITSFVDGENLTTIEADIVCVKLSHKPIIVGKDGNGIKKIGTAARYDIERLLDKKVNLQLYVKVRENWTNNFNYINDLGYNEK